MWEKREKLLTDSAGWPYTFRQRARRVRDYAGISQGEIAARAGLSSPSSVSAFESGQADVVRLSLIGAYLELAKLNGIAEPWVLGFGEEAAPPAREVPPHVHRALAALLGASQHDIPGQSPGAMGLLDAMDSGAFSGPGGRPEILEMEALPKRWQGRYVPIIGRLAAGQEGADTLEAESFEPGRASYYVGYPGAPRDAFAVRIQGDSMIPDYADGDLLIIDPSVRVVSGVCAVVTQVDHERLARTKKLLLNGETAELHSLNRKYKPIKVPAEAVAAFAIWKHLRLAD